MDDRLFGGIDWGGHRHQLSIVDRGGQRLIDRAFAHDRGGMAELRGLLDHFSDAVPIAVERSEGLLVEALLEWGHVVFPVSPRISARCRERYRVASSKDDSFDAFVLADSLRHEHERWRPLSRASPALAELRALVRDRHRVLETQQAVEAQLRATLETYHPAAARLFSSVDRDITLAFIRSYPTPEHAARLGEKRMEAFLKRHSYRGRVPADVLVERLRSHLLHASTGTTVARSRFALAQADLLELLNRQLKDFDRALEDSLAAHPDAKIFLSFPGVGIMIAAMLLSGMGEDRARYPKPGHLLSEAGLAPVTRSSGRMRRVRFRYAANTLMRDAFTWWAYTSIRMSPWARAAYDAGKSRGLHHHRALRGLGARWARVLWRCWQDSRPYDEERHLASI
jgi:transposase